MIELNLRVTEPQREYNNQNVRESLCLCASEVQKNIKNEFSH